MRHTLPAIMDLGECRITPGAADAAEETGIDVPRLVARHAAGDWGDLSAEDWLLNDQAAQQGNRVLSSYRFTEEVVFWIMTEGDRSYTTLMLPDEY